MAAKRGLGRQAWAWAFYDWGNSAFATTVMAGLFPVFFKQYWNAGALAGDVTFRLGMANSAAGLVVALCAPFLGALADRSGHRKGLLQWFTLLGVVFTATLWGVGQGSWLWAAAFYALASVGFSGGLVFYDALLPHVVEGAGLDTVSAAGYALGYLGGGLLFAVNVLMVAQPGWFGLADAASAVKCSFLMAALWWGLFSLPLSVWVHEKRGSRDLAARDAVSAGLRDLRQTVREVLSRREVGLFLVAYWLYIDGVDTVIRMAVDYGMSLGFSSTSLMVALLVTQFVGFPAAVVFGAVGERMGAKRGILLGLAVYLGVVAWGAAMTQVWEFYALAVVIGLVQGGVQALSRSFFARLIPVDRSAQFFSLFNMLGKFAVVMGPVLMGAVAATTGSPRLSILSVSVLFLLGGALLLRVPTIPSGAPS
jgi:UMF1 family MFS transporter